ncbi:MAG: 2-oxo acid dehydrogenase subunit E2 [Gemmatimonadetes bacterium]|nr:2-oxo acid dehydrogenase subunit E2 [Gemmatimonadota bacterium]MBI3566942.1 2-oxo acid dehydrogenase subunit E2 [Gemmatimonadota bacterium]
MPQMGESIAEGTVSRWLKKVGDEVKRDEPIFEISTDKVDAEIPAPTAGVLAEIIVHEGTTVSVNAIVARIETEKGASIAAAPAPAPAAVSAAAAPAAVAAVAAPAPAAATPAAPRASAPAAPNGSFEERVRTKSSPLVRRIAAEKGIEIAALTGTGIAGRVTKRDLVSFLESGAPVPALPAGLPSGAMAVPAMEAHATPMATAWPGDVVEPMTKLRRLTSDHMAQARRVAAHVTTFFEMDLTRLARVRAAMRGEFEAQTGQKLTYLPFIIQATVATLKRHPIINAAVNASDIIYRKRYNIGIAVALEPTGLIVPVIKHAEDLSLSGLAKAANEMASRARSKKLGPADAQDATFTITNAGVFGSIIGTPIIPVGTTAILCLGAIEKRPKVVTGADGEDTIAIRTCAYFSLSFDHRVVDGADADRFMADLKKTLETVPDRGW